MEAKNSFTLTWCEEHKIWYQYNCADCLLDVYRPVYKKEGIKVVVDDIEEAINKAKVRHTISAVLVCLEKWQAFLKK